MPFARRLPGGWAGRAGTGAFLVLLGMDARLLDGEANAGEGEISPVLDGGAGNARGEPKSPLHDGRRTRRESEISRPKRKGVRARAMGQT